MDRLSQSVPPAGTIIKALEKAERYWRGHTDYSGADQGHWIVISASDGGTCYVVRTSRRVAPHNNWWDRLDCDCEAAHAGLRVCWHKAAAWLHYQDALRECKDYRYGN